MSVTWAALLDDYEAFVAELQRSLDTESWHEPFVPFVASAMPSAPATPEERERFTHLQLAAAACERRIRSALDVTRGDLHAIARRRTAGREYGVH